MGEKNEVMSGVFGTTSSKGYLRPTYSKELDGPYTKDPEPRVLETWGIMGTDGKDIIMGWKSSGYRKCGDHGYKGKINNISAYGKNLLESVFKGW